MNEAATRAEHIDPALAAAGWGVVEGSRIRREHPITLGRIEGHGKRGKALSADYVLEYRNTKLAVIEAKAWEQELTEGVAQAKNYAGKLSIRFTCSTNGQGIYGIDMETGKEGEVSAYPAPEELWARTFAKANAWRDRFAAVPFEDRGGYPPDFFDFIVIDECHRGGANDESNWRDILNYFSPAVQLGLTATPKRKDNVDTYAYFGEPVYIYSLKASMTVSSRRSR